MLTPLMMNPDEDICVTLPVIVKAQEDSFGRRMISVEASSEALDGEGDIIDQAALLNSAGDFIKNGHLDYNHYSELHARLGLKGTPSDWIVGQPREVVDLGEGRTGVIAELRRSTDGSFDPHTRIYDSIWRDLTETSPPVKYRASIYGFPKSGMIEDCRKTTCSSGAKRFHIKGMNWKSLALTTNPVNDSLTGFAQVIMAKAFMEIARSANPMPTWIGAAEEALAGSGPRPDPNQPALPTAPTWPLPAPKSMSDAVGQFHTHMIKECGHTGGMSSVLGFKSHFENCCGLDPFMADVFAHATMYHLLRARSRQ